MNHTFTNPLIDSTSPYLLQHAHNPVYWYPWGEQAIARAREENKPILLSIGYSTCYWCHVMERDVFENVSVASMMNQWFINIKVDREEHPEIDATYMVARQLMTHQGGWPNNVFLTPDLKPFYAGGTYSTRESHGQPSFPSLLEWLNSAWISQREQIETAADEIITTMQPFLRHRAAEVPATTNELAEKLFTQLAHFHDERSGGFFQAPKFPHEIFLLALLARHRQTGDEVALNIAMHSLNQMAAGGIYDHIGCGFHRYAVDKDWLVPHFEKMLYNQALLGRAYTEAFAITQDPWLGDIAKSVFDMTAAVFQSPEGAFYAALDAETDQVEGAYYAWTAEELQTLLTPQEISFFTQTYHLAEIPHFPGHKKVEGQVIYARRPLSEVAKSLGKPYVELAAIAGQIMNKLLKARNARPSPSMDHKIITGWNGMMIDAYARAGVVFGKQRYVDIAAKALNYCLSEAQNETGQLTRTVTNGIALHAATLEDYASMIQALITLARAQPGTNWLDAATRLLAEADSLLLDTSGGYYSAGKSELQLIQSITIDESATPNANAMMLHALIDWYALTKDENIRLKARNLAAAFPLDVARPLAEYATWISALSRLEQDNASIVKRPKTKANMEAEPLPFIHVTAALIPPNAAPGEKAEIQITFTMAEDWHINPAVTTLDFLEPTRIEIQGDGVGEVLRIHYPEPTELKSPFSEERIWVYTGNIIIKAEIIPANAAGERGPIKLMLHYQPCNGVLCRKTVDKVIVL